MSGEIVMRMNRHWEVKCPPVKKHVVAGMFVSTVKGVFSGRFVQKKRRITIEIHGPDVPLLLSRTEEKEPTPRRGLTRSKNDTGSMTIVDLSSELKDDDSIRVRILKPRKQWGFMRDRDDSSTSGDDENEYDNEYEQEQDLNASQNTNSSGTTHDDGWIEYRKYDLDEIEDEELHKKSWEATLGRFHHMERREIMFPDDEQAQDFAHELSKLRALVKERSKERLASYQMKRDESKAKLAKASEASSKSNLTRTLSLDSHVNILVEIVSATDLPIADMKSTDPYIVVYLGKQEVHRTKPISKTLNPIWTVDNGSLFILSYTAEELFSYAAGLTFMIKDYDGLSGNETIGKVEVPPTDLLAMTGDRTELMITAIGNLKSKTHYFKPKLQLRVRKATAKDLEFLKQMHAIKKNKKLGVYADQSFVAPHSNQVRLLARESKTVDGVKLHRVKPGPDPAREDTTKWMSSKHISKEATKPSKSWTEAGSGKLGKLFLEIIQCDDLPNLDAGPSGKTDAFCCVIYEDAIVNTDVIGDELSPRWMPWSQRAFLFHIQHPSSQVLVGVFDYDSVGINAHDPIGRVSIDITNFRADTDYLLTFVLHRSVLDNERLAMGKLTVRLRIEYDSYRGFVLGGLALPPFNYLNLAKHADFKTSFFVCNGEENLQRLDMEAIQSYRSELTGYLDVLYYITQALVTVILWRAHTEVKIAGKKIRIPIHSLIAFTMSILLIDNFNYLPSFWLFSIAWLLLATNEQRQRNPSPWTGSMTFLQMWHAVLLDKAPGYEIADHENEAAIRRHQAAIEERKEKEVKSAKEASMLQEKLMAMDEEVDGDVDEDLQTKFGGPGTFNLLAKVLLPLQHNLGLVCRVLRIISSVMTWNESFMAFNIVNACLAAGIVFLFIPWEFLVRWTIRILIWVTLGPWMKLIDIYYVQKLSEEGDNHAKKFHELAATKMKTVNATRRAIMMRREDVTKLRAMKRYMFGKYVTKVPQFKEYRYPDVPCPESKAMPRKFESQRKITKRTNGQRLEGSMIPTWGDAVDKEEIKPTKSDS